MTYQQLLGANDDLRRLWTAQVVSEIGDWLNNVAVFALTLKLAGPGHEGATFAIYSVARHLPLLLFGPIAGVIADQINRRRVMIAADLLRAVLVLGFLVANTLGSVTVIYVVGASMLAVATFFNAAKRAALPNLVSGRENLLTANALMASTTAATIAIGSALGGVLATFLGHNIVIILNALTFLVSADLVRRIKGRTSVSSTDDSSSSNTRQTNLIPNNAASATFASSGNSVARSWELLRHAFVKGKSDFRGGLSYVRADRVLASLFIVAAGWGLGNGAARALYSLFGARLGVASALPIARPADFGISVLFVAMGVGGMIGAPIARRFNASSSETHGDRLSVRMGRSIIFDGGGLALFSLMPTLASAASVLVLREMNFAIWWTAQQTIMMQRTDNRFAGRVFAFYDTTTTLMMIASILVSGFAADTYGMRIVAGTAGIVIALSGALWFQLRRRFKDQLFEEPAAISRESRSSGQ